MCWHILFLYSFSTLKYILKILHIGCPYMIINAENACGNRMCQLTFRHFFFLLFSPISRELYICSQLQFISKISLVSIFRLLYTIYCSINFISLGPCHISTIILSIWPQIQNKNNNIWQKEKKYLYLSFFRWYVISCCCFNLSILIYLEFG